jgi:hypothetical protein
MSVINEIKTLLGMEIKLAQMSLDNGTVIEAEVFEPQQSVFIVNGEDRIAMPVGEYKLEDGNVLEVEVEGIIASIEMPEEVVEEAPAEEEVEVEAEAAPAAPKRIVESVSKEMFFAEIEKLREEIKGLKLSKDEEDKTDEDLKSKEVELSVEPLTHSPEVKDVKIHKFGSNRMLTTQDRVMAKLFNK